MGDSEGKGCSDSLQAARLMQIDQAQPSHAVGHCPGSLADMSHSCGDACQAQMHQG